MGWRLRTLIVFCWFEVVCNVFFYLGYMNMNMVQMGVCSASLSSFSLSFFSFSRSKWERLSLGCQ